jgi:hypothetical protein
MRRLPMKTTYSTIRTGWKPCRYGESAAKSASLPTLSGKKGRRGSGCFVAGTLVHTKEGLKPIEEIQVGDYVLSRSELDGNAELCYQPVTRTYQYDDREVYFVGLQIVDMIKKKAMNEEAYMVVTGGHPIWVNYLVGGGIEHEMNAWMRIEELYFKRYCTEWNIFSGGPDAWVFLSDGRSAFITYIKPLLQTEDPDVGVMFGDGAFWQEKRFGGTIRFDPRGALGPGIPDVGYARNGIRYVTGSFGAAKIPQDGWEISERPRWFDTNTHYSGYDCMSNMSVFKRSGGALPMRQQDRPGWTDQLFVGQGRRCADAEDHSRRISPAWHPQHSLRRHRTGLHGNADAYRHESGGAEIHPGRYTPRTPGQPGRDRPPDHPLRRERGDQRNDAGDHRRTVLFGRHRKIAGGRRRKESSARKRSPE